MRIFAIVVFFFASSTTGFSQNTRIWGVSSSGGAYSNGQIYSLYPDGSDVKDIYAFKSNPDGAIPSGSQIEFGGFVYGVTFEGGSSGLGVIYRLEMTTGQYEVVHHFSGNEGSNPMGLTGTNGKLYGTTAYGGTDTFGTVFSCNTDGSGFVVLYNFTDMGSRGSKGQLLLASNGDLYGAVRHGGVNNVGFLFRIKTDGTSFQKLVDFGGSNIGSPSPYLSEGLGGEIYGGSSFGPLGESFLSSSNSHGGIFKINLDGTGYTEIFQFTDLQNSSSWATSSIIVGQDGDLYGTTTSGGTSHGGTVFKIRTDGTGYTSLFQFSTSSGSRPFGRITQLSDGSLVSIASSEGSSGFGTILKMNSDGTAAAVIVSLTGFNTGSGDISRGAQSTSSVFEASDGLLYVPLATGAKSNNGVILKINPIGAFSKLKEFPCGPTGISDGLLDVDDDFLYGTSAGGGTYGFGTIFRIRKNGENPEMLYSFEANLGSPVRLAQGADGYFYGAIQYSNGTTIFKIGKDGNGFVPIQSLTFAEGTGIARGFVRAKNNNLYGMFQNGGANNQGTIVRLNPDGTGATKIHDFSSGVAGSFGQGILISDDNGDIYGTGQNEGGANGFGTIFKITNDVYSKVYDFTSFGSYLWIMLASDGKIYGASSGGGANNFGFIYSINKNGTGFTTNVTLDGVIGRTPRSYLTEYNGRLYGTERPPVGNGTLFRVNFAGSDYTHILNFSNIQGRPAEKLIFVDKLLQSLSSLPIPTKTIGDAPFNFSASSNTTLPITYSSSNSSVATISNNVIAITGAGKVTIKASQPGNSFYSDASDQLQAFCINPPKPSITASGLILTSSGISGVQWYKNGVAIVSATSPTLAVTESGTYSVTSSVDNCISELSAAQTIIISGLKNDAPTGMNVYPNPAKRILTIEINDFNNSEISTIKILDLTGQVLDNIAITGGKVDVELGTYSQGMYVVNAIQAGKVYRATFIKK